MTVDILVNLNAGRLATDPSLRAALDSAASRGGARVHRTKTLDELDGAAHEIARLGTDAVLLAGGDGTYMAGVSALSRAFRGALPAIGLAPCGTVSTVARNVGVRGSPRSGTVRLIDAACAARTSTRIQPTLRVRDPVDHDPRNDRLGFIFGAGLVARFFDAYYGRPQRGLVAAGAIAFRAFFGSFVGSSFARRILEPTECEITVDGMAHASRMWSLLLASVVRDVGLHLHVAYRAGQKPGHFHVVGSGLRARALGPQMVRVMAGRPLLGEPRLDVHARSLAVQFEPAVGAYVLDGDVFQTRRVQIEPGPELRLLTLR